MSKELSTEEKIREAAKNVFIAKGFDGCTSREIAKAAGMNVALVNYYFCSKNNCLNSFLKPCWKTSCFLP